MIRTLVAAFLARATAEQLRVAAMGDSNTAGRRAVRARGVPADVRDLSVSRDSGPWHEHSAAH